MNIARAKQIAESAETVRVTYEGVPVQIQHVDEQTETARVYRQDQPDEEREVPVRLLEEQ
jgi:small acid-soluble spore protein H (minor)